MGGIGKLRHRLRIREAEREALGGGSYEVYWATLARVWGEITPLRGDQRVMAMGQRSLVTHRIRIRWRDDVRAAMLVTDSKGRRFTIHAVLHVGESGRYCDLLVEEDA